MVGPVAYVSCREPQCTAEQSEAVRPFPTAPTSGAKEHTGVVIPREPCGGAALRTPAARKVIVRRVTPRRVDGRRVGFPV